MRQSTVSTAALAWAIAVVIVGAAMAIGGTAASLAAADRDCTAALNSHETRIHSLEIGQLQILIDLEAIRVRLSIPRPAPHP